MTWKHWASIRILNRCSVRSLHVRTSTGHSSARVSFFWQIPSRSSEPPRSHMLCDAGRYGRFQPGPFCHPRGRPRPASPRYGLHGAPCPSRNRRTWRGTLPPAADRCRGDHKRHQDATEKGGEHDHRSYRLRPRGVSHKRFGEMAGAALFNISTPEVSGTAPRGLPDHLVRRRG